jgi:hypothetical protein
MEASNDLTDRKESHTTNLVILIFFFVIATALASVPLISVIISPLNNTIRTTKPFPAAYAQLSENYNDTIAVPLGDPFQLRINQTAVIIPDNASISFMEVPEDSRCPASVVCVSQGKVTVSLNLTESFSGFPRILNLTLGPVPSNSSSNIDDHAIELLQVEPYPITDEGISKSDYRITLVATPPPPIPAGEWDIVSNGLTGKLNITSIDSQGHLNGTILLYPFDTPLNEISGYVDGDSGKVTFVRIIGPGPGDIEVYTGYVFSNIIASCLTGTGPGSCYDHSQMAGTFQSFYASDTGNNTSTIGTFGDATRNTFGWIAYHVPQLCQDCP